MRWITPEDRNILSQNEGTVIEPIKFEIEGSNNYEIIKVSGDFPQGIELIKEDDGYYYLEGKLGYVPETTTFYFTLQATDLDTGKELEHWYSMEVVTLNTEWDDNNIISHEIYEKQFFQYQYNLINPEGNEIFKKISGELPEGLTLSETGLLYGVPEEDREKPFYFRIGIYRNDNLIIETSIDNLLSVKVKNISEMNKPIWITDEGILDYINYGIEKNLQVIAYDFSGHDVFYELVNSELPAGIKWTTIDEYIYENEISEKTGKLYGKCLTKVTSDQWFITLKPYIIINDVKEYGDERTFIIVTNAVEKDDLITWVTETLEPVKIGYSYNLFIEATSSSKVIFELASGNLPNGLFLNKNGEIYGTVNYQDLGNYEFYIKAYTQKAFSTKKFSIEVIKGFSKDSLDVFLYINKEYQEEYQNMLIPFDRTSAYNSSNSLYKIPSSPTIYLGSLNTYDKILLKHKMEQFNTPIDIFMKEIKKKSMGIYDLFYKDFTEVNKISENHDLKIHSEYDEENEKNTETPMIDRYGREFIPGYIRKYYYDDNVDVIFNVNGTSYSIKNIDPDTGEITDPNTGKILEGEYIFREFVEDPKDHNNDKIVWYYSNLNTKSGEEVFPEYIPSKNTYDYAWFGRPYVYLNDINERVYVREVPKDTYFEIESKKIIKRDIPIYIEIQTLLTGEEIVKKYVLDENENKIEVDILDEPMYVSYNPRDTENSDEYIIDPKRYSKIEIDANLNNYYEFNSSVKYFKTSSINAIREVFSESYNVEKREGIITYKVGNQEIINLDEIKSVYNITKDEQGRYFAKFNNELGNEEIFYVYHKINDNDYKPIFYKDGNEYKPLIQKEFMLYGEVDNIYYTIYKKGSNIIFDNSLFIFDNGNKYYIKDNQWFLLDEIENPYIYHLEDDIDIVLPYVKDEHVKDNQVTFLDKDEEKEYLPEYMIDTTLPFWKSFTEYNVGNEVVYRDYSYICIKKHKSSILFDKEYWDKKENLKKYIPIIPLYFALSYSHDTVLKNVNAYEKEGNYWYGRKFIFYEIHFEPKYGNNDTFTIDFYNHVNENSPEFKLI